MPNNDVGQVLAWVKLILQQMGVWDLLITVLQVQLLAMATIIVFRVLGGAKGS